MKKPKKTAPPDTTPTSLPAVYQASDGAIALRPDAAHETVWATLEHTSKIFGRDKLVISRHLKSIFSSGELDRGSVVAKNATTAADGKIYLVEHFNLDVILSVGYRVNSVEATKFRRWANDVLKRYLAAGYAVNQERLAASSARLAELRESVEIIAATGDAARSLDDARGLLALIRRYSRTWTALERYDRDEAVTPGDALRESANSSGTAVRLDSDALLADLAQMRAELARHGEATELFARERSPGSLAAAVGATFQSFDGRDVYPTPGEKAANPSTSSRRTTRSWTATSARRRSRSSRTAARPRCRRPIRSRSRRSRCSSPSRTPRGSRGSWRWCGRSCPQRGSRAAGGHAARW